MAMLRWDQEMNANRPKGIPIMVGTVQSQCQTIQVDVFIGTKDKKIIYNSHAGSSTYNERQICKAEGPTPASTPAPTPEPTPPPATSPAGCTILVDTPSAAERKAVCLCECKALVTADFLCPSWAWQETNEACPNSGDGNVCDYMCNRIGHSGYQTGGVRHASIGHNDNNFNNTGQPKLKSFTFVKMQVNTMYRSCLGGSSGTCYLLSNMNDHGEEPVAGQVFAEIPQQAGQTPWQGCCTESLFYWTLKAISCHLFEGSLRCEQKKMGSPILHIQQSCAGYNAAPTYTEADAMAIPTGQF